jgi:UDP-N-acetyl-alpha-D-muramoyl-L-alanyl-L-glutamate epimerase
LNPLYPEPVAAPAVQTARFDPASIETFRFTRCELDDRGRVALHYALDDRLGFVERFDLPVAGPLELSQIEKAQGLLALLHWTAGVSYFKTALPEAISCEAGTPPPATAAFLEALYSDGLGEFAYRNDLAALPRPRFPVDRAAAGAPARGGEGRVLVPVGGGKDSAVALEVVRRAGVELELFSVGNAPPIARTAAAAGLPHLVAIRRLDPQLAALNDAGALNGHVPITAIVSCVALLAAELNGFDAVAMANERSASSGNVVWRGVEINHQFSKSLRAESLQRAALAETGSPVQLFSILRPASELAIARAFARLERYHDAFTSCNAIFRSAPAPRTSSWCCDCPKCRFVFLVLAPFSEPAHLQAVFGRDLLDDPGQYEGFALLTATGGHKPFECVGEEDESLAAIRMLAGDERWRSHAVVRRLVEEVLPAADPASTDPARFLELSDAHHVPEAFLPAVRALLGA